MLVTAGAIIGSLAALWIFSVLYMIDPSNDAPENQIIARTITYQEVDNATVEVENLSINTTELTHFVQWAGFPIFLLIFVVFLIAALKSAPWQDIAAILLIATLMGGVADVFRATQPSQRRNRFK